MPFTIRSMTESDDCVVSELRAAGYRFIAEPDHFTDAQLQQLLQARCLPDYTAWTRRQWVCYVAEENDEVVGVIAVGENVLQELWVLPSCHRQGIGTALFRVAEDLIRQSGHTTMTVSTSGYGRPFYEAMGMKLTGYKIVPYGPLAGRQHMILEKKLIGE